MNLDELLSREVEEIIVRKDLEKKLKSGRKLRIKLGADPTKPDLHLGHGVVLRVLKKFQDEGHTVIFVVGDYTVRIGDPTDRNKTRPLLPEEEIKKNAQTYFDQVGKILDIREVEIRKNSEWYGKLSLGELIKITSKFTVARILERDDFFKRYRKKIPIGLHEFLYPVMQAYDSLVLKADIEIGGSDQRFNMLSGRELQEKMGQTPQDIIICRILEGTDGKQKMSKSLGNYIALNDPPLEMYGKIMSIPDSLIIKYFLLSTNLSLSEIKKIEKGLKERKLNPRDVKAHLAFLVTSMYHEKEESRKAAEEFERIFRMKKIPQKLPEISLKLALYNLPDLLVSANLVGSKSEAKRLIEQGGVKIDGETIRQKDKKITIKDGMIIQVGKRKFVKIKKEI